MNETNPFVINHTKFEGSDLVSEENRAGPGVIDKNLKIPNVANEHKVRVLKFFDYVRTEGWSF